MTEETNVSTSSDPQQIPGVILRGSDGTLYFVPDRALATFNVTSSMGKAAVQDKFDAMSSGSETTPKLEAYQVTLPDTLFGKAEVFR